MLDPLKFLLALALLIALGPGMAAIVAASAVFAALAFVVGDEVRRAHRVEGSR